MYAGNLVLDEETGLEAYEGDWAPHFNIRERDYTQDWQDRFWPICHVVPNVAGNGRNSTNITDATVSTARLDRPSTQPLHFNTGFAFRNPPHFVPNTGEREYVQGGGGEGG
jgi:hypothetical protein